MTTLAPGTGRSRPPSRTVHAPLRHREVHAMNTQIQFMQAVHADRLARLHAEARQARLARSARSARTDARRLRRALGRSLVRVGQRIAAEASAPERPIEHLTPAGSR
jgi:hypothetical protein